MAKKPKDEAVKLVERLIAITDGDDDGSLEEILLQLRDRLKNPMALVLSKVPGSTVVEKCKKIGITRQNYYAWLRGTYRPDVRQVKKLAKLTGLDLLV